MSRFLINSALDRRFVDLVCFMCIGVWPWLFVISAGLAFIAWKLVVLCQLIALPFSVIGWALGFRGGRAVGLGARAAAMVAGWGALLTAEVGLAIVINVFWTGRGGAIGGLIAFPALAVLVTIGVLWLYRAETWLEFGVQAERKTG